MINDAGPKSESMKKTKAPTREELLRRGPVPEYFLGYWRGRDPEGDEVIDECYEENQYQLYHDWPYRCEGVVFHNRQDMMEFAWSLSRNQDRDVWVQTPTGFPEPTNWWSEERMTRDGTWDAKSAALLKERQENRTHKEPDQPTIDLKLDPPSRAEANGRRKAYWDPKLKKTVITDEYEEENISPNRKRQLEHLKRLGIDPESPEAKLAKNQWDRDLKAPNASQTQTQEAEGRPANFFTRQRQR